MAGSLDDDAQLEDTVRASASEISTDPFERSSALASGVMIGRYRLGARLGAGAMGEVWSATDPQLEREVAIKLVHPRLARDPEVSARLLREARAMAKVSHRAVIAIHDAGETDGRLFLAMELVRGRTLGAMLSSRSPSERADWRRWLALMIEAGRGLAAAHAAGVLHRDFKPDNILVDGTNRVGVGDFGLASLAGAQLGRMSQPVITSSTELDLTTTGALLGTPAYMSLEQLRGDGVDARSDQFSFCVATYEALYGERPYAVPESERGNIAVLLEMVAAARVREPVDPNTVPPAIRAILLRGLAAAPGDRWPDLDALLAALAKAGAPATSRRSYLAIGVAIVIGLGIALAIRGLRHPAITTATRIQPLPFNATIARSPGGRFAIAADRIDITDPTTGKTFTWPTRAGWIDAVQFEDEATVRWADRSQPGKVWRWRYASADPVLTARGDSHWLGAVREGDVSEKFGIGAPNEIDLDRGGVTLMRWPRDGIKVELSTFAPAGHRFAYLATERFNGHIVVIDTSTYEMWRSPDIVEPTGLGWRTDDRLLYGTADGWIHELPINASGFGTARDVYRLEKGWAGRILGDSGSFELVVHTPVSHVRAIDREPVSVRDFEPSVAAVEVGFTSDGRFLVWNPRTRHLERRTETEIGDTLEAQLDAEPANATCAGDLLIAAERGIGGRKLVAVSLSTGKRLWEHPVGASLLARCANDRTPPCYVARRVVDPNELYEVLSLDPQTGIASGTPVYRGKLEDIAVRADGQRILIGNGTLEIREIDLHGTVTGKPVPTMSSVRSIAYDTDGSVLYGGTIIGGSYAVGRFANDQLSVLSRSDGVLLSMVRPSPTSAQILTLGRSVSSDLFELHPP